MSTYSLAYTVSGAYTGGVLAPNGDIHFVPYCATVGQKISIEGIVSTYPLVYTVTDNCWGGIVSGTGDIYFIPKSASVGQKILNNSAQPFSKAMCLSPFFNKF